MSRIQRLSPVLASQIAAGEVIERPVSVLKELLENSLDAGADRIDVEIGEGGRALIRVTDNGAGICRDDLALALAPHATSKIGVSSDLERIQTLGFRGEALASIGAVSRLILTSTVAGETGWQVRTGSIGLQEGEVLPAAHPRGTTVEVRDLFFSLPARRKFLRTEKTEFDHIDEMLRRLALSAFSVRFTLTHNQKTIRQYRASLSPAEQAQRVAGLCGEDFMQHALRLSVEREDMTLSGWVALPAFSRVRADMQYFYVNQRMVRDRTLSHAVREAFHDILYGHRYPAFVLFLGLPHERVDVNVHPGKLEVRFQESRSVHDFVCRSLQAALAEGGRPGLSPETVNRTLPVQQGIASLSQTDRQPRASFQREARAPSRPDSLAAWQALHAPTQKTENTPTAPAVNRAAGQLGIAMPPLGHALAQLGQIYILAENAQGLVLVDMHAAHERILYEKMKREMAEGGPVSQPLLLPLTLNLRTEEVDALLAHASLLEKTGLRIDCTGPTSLRVREVPALLREGPVETVIRDVASDLLSGQDTGRLERLVNQVLGNMACRTALHARRQLDVPEMNALLRVMETTDHASYCNHGRPTVRQFSLAELDALFLRGR